MTRTACLRALMGIAAAAALAACTSTSRFAAEYKQQYRLAEDVHLYSCSTFTGLYSVWFGGPQKAETICSSAIPVAGATTLKKGCPVRVLKLFRIAAIDASYSDAKLQIEDPDSGTTHVVYVKWPGARSLLDTDSAAPAEPPPL